MISVRLINKVLSDLRDITGADLLLTDAGGKVLAAAASGSISEKPSVLTAAVPEGESGTVQAGSWYIRRVADADGTELFIAAAGEAGELAARVGSSEMEALLIAAREKTDKGRFLQSVLTGTVPAAYIHQEAVRLRIREDACRILFLAELNESDCETAIQVFRAVLAAARTGGMIAAADASHVTIVYETPRKDREDGRQAARYRDGRTACSFRDRCVCRTDDRPGGRDAGSTGHGRAGRRAGSGHAGGDCSGSERP